LSRPTGAVAWSLLNLACAVGASAQDTYNPSTGQLSIPLMYVGIDLYENVVVNVGSIVSAPSMTTPAGPYDTYDPVAGQLSVPSVLVGDKEYTNVVVTVAKLDSIGAVGADRYANGSLQIPLVLSGSTYTKNETVAITPASVLNIGGGMPSAASDVYDAGSHQLTVAAVQVGNTVYTNVLLSVTSITAPGVTLANQTIQFAQPAALVVGASEALSATASSGVPVGYTVKTPGVCAVTGPGGAQYFYFSFAGTTVYSGVAVGGSGVLGTASLGNGAYFTIGIDGSIGGEPVSLLPTTDWNTMLATTPYLVYVAGDYLVDDVVFNPGNGQVVDTWGLGITTPGNGINIGGDGPGTGTYYYGDDAGSVEAISLTMSPVSGLVGLAPGTCTVMAYAPGWPYETVQTAGGQSYAPAPTVTYSVAVTAPM
jgi:hypothetical protein